MSKRPSTVPLSRNCSDCGTPISQQSKGRCKSCATAYYNRLPETKIKRAEGWKKRLADPEKYAQVCRVAARNSQKAMADPVKLAEAQERARNMYRLYLDTPESRAKVLASRASAGRKLSEYRLAWCPPEYRELHHENVKKHRIPAALSREMIERRIANDKALKNIEDALYFLRKFAPVQVLENGYRYGNAILTPAEIIARAKVRGCFLAENDDDPGLKPEHVLEAYNAMAVRAGLPHARMTPERRKKLPGFIRRNSVDDITEAISAMERSPLCRGENDRQWKADFDFLLQPKSFTRLIEGTYGR
jgi:hypothetical protein